MEKVIKWVYRTIESLEFVKFQYESNIQDLKKLNESKIQELKRLREEYKDGWGFVPEYQDYTNILSANILTLSNDNQKRLIQLLFSKSWVLFEVCKDIKEAHKYNWVLHAVGTYGKLEYDIIKQTHNALFYDLFNFYEEVFILCRICDISIQQMHPLYEYSDIVNDLTLYWRLNRLQLAYYKQTGVIPLDAYLIKDKLKVLNAIDNELANCKGAQGKRIALIICALEEYGYIANIDGNIERIYEAFKHRYTDKVASRQGVSQYINAHRNPKAITDKPKFSAKELKLFIDKI